MDNMNQLHLMNKPVLMLSSGSEAAIESVLPDARPMSAIDVAKSEYRSFIIEMVRSPQPVSLPLEIHSHAIKDFVLAK